MSSATAVVERLQDLLKRSFEPGRTFANELDCSCSWTAGLTIARKAPAAARALPKLANRAREEQWSYEQFAATLLKTEIDSRDSHGGQARIKVARFPATKTIQEFDVAFQASLRRDTVLHPAQLHFLAVRGPVFNRP